MIFRYFSSVFFDVLVHFYERGAVLGSDWVTFCQSSMATLPLLLVEPKASETVL